MVKSSLVFLACVCTSLRASAPEYAIEWFTIATGGGAVAARDFEIHSTMGQSEVSIVSAGGWILESGFWQSERSNAVVIKIEAAPAGQFRFIAQNDLMISATVQVSTDLQTWRDLGAILFVNGTAEFSDAIAPTEITRFYRLKP